MPKIVLSYRRADSAGVAGRVFDHLVTHYGKSAVYMDIDNIPYGVDFREHIGKALDASDALVVVIGPDWLKPDETGVVRIREENDFVRVEIETALKKAIPVIPVLVDRTRMPKPADLPESLNAFAFRNAADIDSGRDFHAHMERLLRSMDSLIGPQPNGPALTFQSGATDAPAASLGTAANQAAKPGTRRFRLLGWLGWYLVTLVPMWVFLAADRQNGSQAFLDLFLVIVAGVVPAARGQRTWKQAALFGAAVGTGFTIAVLATAPRAPSADQFLGIGATSIGVGAVLTLISHAVGVYLRRRRTRPAVR